MIAGALTEDRFLGGRVCLQQPKDGFRSGIDAVLLAAAVPAAPGQAVLELGCGAGAASLCLAARVPGLVLAGVELQPDYAALARRNAGVAGVAMEVATADLRALPADLRGRSFDHVFANPPYFCRSQSVAASDAGREQALGGDTPLADWLAAGARRLRPGGTLTLIQRAERLADLMAALAPLPLGACELLPLAPRAGRPARLILLRARKDRRTPLTLCAPVVLHDGAAHVADGDDYTHAIGEVLRNAAPLPGFLETARNGGVSRPGGQ